MTMIPMVWPTREVAVSILGELPIVKLELPGETGDFETHQSTANIPM
jgi:hypothetical protein